MSLVMNIDRKDRGKKVSPPLQHAGREGEGQGAGRQGDGRAVGVIAKELKIRSEE